MMKIVSQIFFFGLLGVLFGCDFFAPGSYPYAETYEFPLSEGELVELISSVKNEYKFNMPKNLEFKDGKSNPQELWHYVYFYDDEDNNVYLTWIRKAASIDIDKSTFALVSIYNPKYPKRWMSINRDFSNAENKAVKKRFEIRILSLIKNRI